ncbi:MULTISPECIES: hypothetical protein [Paenibacillus]|uniref:hypothetical protein n=1 Tax=Paenibacillus TaxID=44249 RepID=UPI001123A98B|nr:MULTISPECIES: hypothetical protein [Paenibacillus]
MIWSVLIMVFLLLVPLIEMPYLKGLQSRRDVLVFLLIWGIALAAIAAECFGIPLPKPLDWIRVMTNPIQSFMP